VPHDKEGARVEDRPNREVLNTQGRPDRIKVFQVNLGRGREATELLQRMADRKSGRGPQPGVVLLHADMGRMEQVRRGMFGQDRNDGQDQTAVDRIRSVCRAKHQDSDHRRGKRRHRVY
jgi:hypothetical protein